MSLVLLADDSPHAQRMGERILREEGFEVVTATDGETALVRLRDADPDVVLADAFLPVRSGLELCRFIKASPGYQRTRIVVTAGMLEQFNEDEARSAGCDAVLRKPFEASAVLAVIRTLVGASAGQRASRPVPAPMPAPSTPPAAARRTPAPVDPARVRAAVTVALDASMPKLIDEITERVLIALGE